MLKTISLIVLVAAVGTAVAAGTWSDSVKYRPTQNTSIRVLEPKGFRVTIDTPDGVQTGTVPELFKLANEDAYVKVTLTAPDGTSWSNKVEVRQRNQAELTVNFKPDAAPAQEKENGKDTPRARSFIMEMQNKGNTCDATSPWRATISADFLRASDGERIQKVQLDDDKSGQIELPSDAYDVRVFSWNGSEWKLAVSKRIDTPARDGFKLAFGCTAKSGKSPVLIPQ